MNDSSRNFCSLARAPVDFIFVSYVRLLSDLLFSRRKKLARARVYWRFEVLKRYKRRRSAILTKQPRFVFIKQSIKRVARRVGGREEELDGYTVTPGNRTAVADDPNDDDGFSKKTFRLSAVSVPDTITTAEKLSYIIGSKRATYFIHVPFRRLRPVSVERAPRSLVVGIFFATGSPTRPGFFASRAVYKAAPVPPPTKTHARNERI